MINCVRVRVEIMPELFLGIDQWLASNPPSLHPCHAHILHPLNLPPPLSAQVHHATPGSNSTPTPSVLPRFIIPSQAVADLVYDETIVPLLPLGWGLPILLKFGKLYRVRYGDRCTESGTEIDVRSIVALEADAWG